MIGRSRPASPAVAGIESAAGVSNAGPGREHFSIAAVISRIRAIDARHPRAEAERLRLVADLAKHRAECRARDCACRRRPRAGR